MKDLTKRKSKIFCLVLVISLVLNMTIPCVNAIEFKTSERIRDDEILEQLKNGSIMPLDEKDNQKEIKGDIDGNGVLTANDAAMLLDIYKNGNATPEQTKLCDMDGNGTLTANDAAIILDMYKNGK